MEIINFIENIKWNDMGAFLGSLGAFFLTLWTLLGKWDARKKEQQDEKHAQELELAQVKHENANSEMEAQKKINDSQGAQINDLNETIKLHTKQMKELATQLEEATKTMEERYSKVFYGTALIHRENKNIREQMQKFSTVHQKLSEYATMITSKKE